MTNMSVTFILVSARLFLPKSDLILATQKGGNKPNNNLFIYFFFCDVKWENNLKSCCQNVIRKQKKLVTVKRFLLETTQIPMVLQKLDMALINL